MSAAPPRLFVYGTLLDPACVRRVVGRSLAARPARLRGWTRHAPSGGYPFVLPDPDGLVEGAVLEGADEAALARLDTYEGDLYRREVVAAEVDGAAVSCFVYTAA